VGKTKGQKIGKGGKGKAREKLSFGGVTQLNALTFLYYIYIYIFC